MVSATLYSKNEVETIIKRNVSGKDLSSSFVTTVRGIQVNLENKDYAIFLGAKSQFKEQITSLVKSAGYLIKKDNSRGIRLHGHPEQHLLGYKELIDCIEQCEIDGLGYGRDRNPIFVDKNKTEDDLFLVSAKKIKTLVDNDLGHILKLCAREILYADYRCSRITKGQSDSYSAEQGYREHVVPCTMLAELAALKLKAGESIEMVAKFLKEHLAIILINKKEADLLDNEFGFKTTMPDHWEIGDSVYARLECAEIPFTLFD